MNASRSYRSLIHDISQELSSEDAQGLKFLAALPPTPGSGRCCQRCSVSALELLQLMQDRGVYSHYDLGPLVELLQEIGRQDLASKCEQFLVQPSMASSARSDSSVDFAVHSLDGEHAPLPPVSTSWDGQHSPPSPLDSSWEDLSSPPTTPTCTSSFNVPLLSQRHLSKSTSKLLGLKQMMTCKLFRHHRGVTGSCDEGLDSFHIVGQADLADYPGHAPSCAGHAPSCAGHASSAGGKLLCSQSFDSSLPPNRGRRSWTDGGKDSGNSISSGGLSLASPTSSTSAFPTCNHTPFQGGLPTCTWPLKRSDFIGPIFNHTNKSIEKKFRVRAGTKESGCDLTFALKLYPNGVNWDQDSAASLQVKVLTSLSPHTSSVLYFGVTVVEDRSSSQQVLTQRRRVCKLKEEREFLLKEFLSHEVVKTSQAKLLCMLFRVDVCYLLGEDWVCIGTEHNLGCIMDPANL